MSYYSVQITCPRCFAKLDSDDLAENNTEYGCWSSEHCTVNCPKCDQYFEVSCEHAGWHATDSFDIRQFLKIHKIVIPYDTVCYTFAAHFLRDLATEGSCQRVVAGPKYADQQEKWDAAYEFAIKEWERISVSL